MVSQGGGPRQRYCSGLLLRKWLGVPQDYAEAVKWYRKAAGQGHAEAQSCLGFCYAKGQGTPKDYTEAAKWFRKAAEQGQADDQCNLGQSYEFGLVCRKIMCKLTNGII